MHSFLFPEDLGLPPTNTIQCEAPRQQKLQDAVLLPLTKKRRPLPVILPPTFQYDAYKPDEEIVVSVTRLSLDERSPRLGQKFKKPSTLTRWKSATLSKQDKDEREVRMALAEAERAAHASSRSEHRSRGSRSGLYAPLESLSEERDNRLSPLDYGVHHVVF